MQLPTENLAHRSVRYEGEEGPLPCMSVCTDVLMFSHPALLNLERLLAWTGPPHKDLTAESGAKFMEKSKQQILAWVRHGGWDKECGSVSTPISCTGMKYKELFSLGITVKYTQLLWLFNFCARNNWNCQKGLTEVGKNWIASKRKVLRQNHFSVGS